MPKYFSFMICGYFLYFTSHCTIEAMHVHANKHKLIAQGSAKFFVKSNGDTTIERAGSLNEREISKIRAFIKDNYEQMYITWREYSNKSYYMD